MAKEVCICLHGHFYQPPRENPWIEEIERQDSAAPFHDWNERIHYECYHPNSRARALDAKGKIRKTYPLDMVQTPLDKLASLAGVNVCLRQGVTITQLRLQAKALSDLDAANAMNVARLKLFDLFNRRSKSAA